jgi:hypothetical protein
MVDHNFLFKWPMCGKSPMEVRKPTLAILKHGQKIRQFLVG